MVTNLRHELVKLTDLDQRILPLLDGTHTRAELTEALVPKALAGELKVTRNNAPVTDEPGIRAALGAVVEPALQTLAGHAVIVG